MTASPVDSVLPVQETVAHKVENLEWANIPPGSCELEFRPALEISFRECCTVFAFLSVASVLAVPLAWCLGRFLAPHVSRFGYALPLTILGIVLAAVYQLRKRDASNDHPPKLLDAATVARFAAPLFAWLTVLLTGQLSEPVGAFMYLFFVALPMTIIVADQVALHAIHWMSANMQVDNATRAACREDWKGRFLADPSLTLPSDLAGDAQAQREFAAVCRSRTSYFTGPLWLLAAFLVPDFLLLALTSDPNPGTIGLQLLVASMLGLLLVCFIRTGGQLAVVDRVWAALIHWLFYGNREPMPPWVFHSPIGGLWRRRVITAIAISLLSVAIGHLGGKSTLFVVFMPTESNAAATAVQPPTTFHQQHDRGSTEPCNSFGTSHCAWIAIAFVCYSLLPITTLFLSSVVVLGPILFSYHNALED